MKNAFASIVTVQTIRAIIQRVARKFSAVALGCLLLPALLATFPAQAQTLTPAQQTAAIDQFMTGTFNANVPGAALIVVSNGNNLIRKAYGMANMELNLPLTPTGVFEVGSVTKQFTAAAILLLEQQGRLSLQDRITKYLPGYPAIGNYITIQQLLTHTSGIGDPVSTPAYFSGPIRLETTPALLTQLIASTPQVSSPGTQYVYNNSGYMLLGAIIENVSGMSYANFLQKNIFQPLGLTHTQIGGLQLITGRVAGYSLIPGTTSISPASFYNADYVDMTQAYSAGSVMTTIDDLASWNKSLFTSGVLLNSMELARMSSYATLTNGTAIPVGDGWNLSFFNGVEAYTHDGSINGFSAYVVSIPKQNLYVALLSNVDDIPVQAFADHVASIVLGTTFQN